MSLTSIQGQVRNQLVRQTRLNRIHIALSHQQSGDGSFYCENARGDNEADKRALEQA